MLTILAATLAAGLAASAAALLLYRKVRRMRRTEEELAHVSGTLLTDDFYPDLEKGIRRLDKLAKNADPGTAADLTMAVAKLARQFVEMKSLYTEYRKTLILPPCFVPRTLGPDGIERGLGRAEGPGCEAAGYAAWPFRSEWMEFHPVNPRYAWFALVAVYGPEVVSASTCRTVAALIRNEYDGRKDSLFRPGTLPEVLYRINEHVEGEGVKGTFTSILLGLYDNQEKEAVLCGAGYDWLRRWSAASRSFLDVEIPKSPPVSSFPNFLVETKAPLAISRVKLDPGDVLFINGEVWFASRFIRDSSGNQEFHTANQPGEYEVPRREELAATGIDSLLSAVGSRSTWRLEKEGGLPGEEDLVFDFSACEGRPEDFALALAAAERIFRMYPDPGAGPEDRVYLDPETDAFLVRHFPKVGLYRKEGMVRVLEGPELGRAGGGGSRGEGKVVAWGGVREDRQYDVSVLAIGRKE